MILMRAPCHRSAGALQQPYTALPMARTEIFMTAQALTQVQMSVQEDEKTDFCSHL